MPQLGEARMANKYGRKRIDNHTKRKVYKSKYDETGKKGKENMIKRAFWREHTVSDMMKLTSKQLDAAIDALIDKYEKIQIKRDPNWWYPEQDGRTLSESRYNKKLDKEEY